VHAVIARLTAKNNALKLQHQQQSPMRAAKPVSNHVISVGANASVDAKAAP